jgi:hypothetical protein
MQLLCVHVLYLWENEKTAKFILAVVLIEDKLDW